MTHSAVMAESAAAHEHGHGHSTPFQHTLRVGAGRANGWLLAALRATKGRGMPKFYSKPLRPPIGWAGAHVEATALTARALLRYGIANNDALSLSAA
ncbi:MAG: hypothetical protein AB7N71_03625, partial [Phycisphaerae bacterium]